MLTEFKCSGNKPFNKYKCGLFIDYDFFISFAAVIRSHRVMLSDVWYYCRHLKKGSSLIEWNRGFKLT